MPIGAPPGSSSPVPRFKTGVYYGTTGFGRTTMTLAANTLYYLPFWVPAADAFDRLAIDVTTLGAGSAARLGLYAETAALTGEPGALIVDAGTVDTSTTGFKAATIATSLTSPGWYFLGVVSQGGSPAAVRALSNGRAFPIWSSASAAGDAISFIEAGVAGALPATATPAFGVSPAPIVVIRAA